jgi:hypothetical protein
VPVVKWVVCTTQELLLLLNLNQLASKISKAKHKASRGYPQKIIMITANQAILTILHTSGRCQRSPVCI